MEKAILCTDFLRSAYPSNMFSSGLCLWAPIGKGFSEKEELYIAEGDIFTERSCQALHYFPPPLLNEQQLSQLLNSLHPHHLMLLERPRKQVSRDIIDAIRLYSRGSKTKHLDEKIVFTFASIESILLQNATEPTSAIADRFAIFVAKNPDERRETAKLIKRIYDYRSKFVHHGSTLSTANRDAVDNFLKYAWSFFLTLPGIRHNFTTKQELINYLDDMKYDSSKRLF